MAKRLGHKHVGVGGRDERESEARHLCNEQGQMTLFQQPDHIQQITGKRMMMRGGRTYFSFLTMKRGQRAKRAPTSRPTSPHSCCCWRCCSEQLQKISDEQDMRFYLLPCKADRKRGQLSATRSAGSRLSAQTPRKNTDEKSEEEDCEARHDSAPNLQIRAQQKQTE